MSELLDQFREFIDRIPYFRLLDVRVHEWTPELTKVVLNVEAKHLNGQGQAQGGLVASLVDAAGGLAAVAAAMPNGTAVTMQLSVNYVAPVRPGQVTALGRVVHNGTRSVVSDVEIRHEDGTLTTRGTVTLLKLLWNEVMIDLTRKEEVANHGTPG